MAGNPPQKNVDVEGAKKRIRAAFELFDKEGKGCVIQEEVSTIMRYLGAFPSEKDMVEKILPEIQEDEPTAFVTYGKFEELMLQVLTTHAYDFLLPDTEHVLLAAFKTRDPDGKGYLESDRHVFSFSSRMYILYGTSTPKYEVPQTKKDRVGRYTT